MESIFEQQRKSLETIDLVEFLISESYFSYPKKHKERLIIQHQIKLLLNESVKHIDFLSDSFNISSEFLSESGSNTLAEKRSHEMLLLESSPEMNEFYNRLRAIKEFHRPHPDDVAKPLYDDLRNQKESISEESLETKFSGEETFGKYLDLNVHYENFINLKTDTEKVDYFSYLDSLNKQEGSIPKEIRELSSYKKYLEELFEYLKNFICRAKPLINISYVECEYLKTFESEFPETQEDEFYCDVCSRNFAKETVFKAHFQGSKHKKALEKPMSGSGIKRTNSRHKQIRILEYLVKKLCSGILSEEITATKSNVERKQSRTAEELLEDIEEEEEETQIEEENAEHHLTKAQEEKLYNPLKLPLGWDGKPIPYWLYKLHGLGVSYSCEICGNYVYMGRKAFDKHFQEWRHSYGMRCLGIPNTRHFQDITMIKEALSLWERVKKDNKTEVFKPEIMEEFEDFEGNVYSRKTFDDLSKQGLL